MSATELIIRQLMGLVVTAIAVAFSFLYALFLMLAWNTLAGMFHFPALTFWGAFFLCLARIIFIQTKADERAVQKSAKELDEAIK